MAPAAYDYQAQQWVTGAEAIPLKASQITEELKILKSPMGRSYAHFIGLKDDEFPTYIKCLEDNLAIFKQMSP